MKKEDPFDPTKGIEYILTLIATGLLLVILFMFIAAGKLHAEGRNWCSDWSDGYVIGFCWARPDCSYIPPKVCPSPEKDETDGYIVGLRDGLTDGRVKE